MFCFLQELQERYQQPQNEKAEDMLEFHYRQRKKDLPFESISYANFITLLSQTTPKFPPLPAALSVHRELEPGACSRCEDTSSAEATPPPYTGLEDGRGRI
ncbi:uncharacterized protein AAGF69_015798 isoform 1-T2 [Amazona ochrocephala]